MCSSLKQKFLWTVNLHWEDNQMVAMVTRMRVLNECQVSHKNRGLTSKPHDLVHRKAQCKREWMLSPSSFMYLASVSFCGGKDDCLIYHIPSTMLLSMSIELQYKIYFLIEKSITCSNTCTLQISSCYRYSSYTSCLRPLFHKQIWEQTLYAGEYNVWKG